MHRKHNSSWLLAALLLVGLVFPIEKAQAVSQDAAPAQVTAYDLIVAMNTLRMANGLPALIEHPIVNAVAQSTAEIMAANQMSWHIGDVRGRIAAAGYGSGATVFATENFSVGYGVGIDEIMVMWADPDHMRPAVNPAYCHVGAGVADAGNGRIYYVLQAAYISGEACGEYKLPDGASDSNSPPAASTISQLIYPVKIAAPDADGRVYHLVEYGQSFWSIAVAYQVTIQDLEVWNNLSRESKLQPGQKLFIPSKNTEGYATPTPVGNVVRSTPDANGKILHIVKSHQTLTTIAQAYDVTVENILALNGIQVDWPLQIDQKLLISPGNVTPSPTPQPLTPLERLTPESDGNYYHVVNSGETLSWIAGLYGINYYDLMAWNGLNESSVIWPDQKLLLRVTPPSPTATITWTPGPPTATASSTPKPVQPTMTATAAQSPQPTTPALGSGGNSLFDQDWIGFGLPLAALLAAAGLFILGLILRRKK